MSVKCPKCAKFFSNNSNYTRHLRDLRCKGAEESDFLIESIQESDNSRRIIILEKKSKQNKETQTEHDETCCDSTAHMWRCALNRTNELHERKFNFEI